MQYSIELFLCHHVTLVKKFSIFEHSYEKSFSAVVVLNYHWTLESVHGSNLNRLMKNVRTPCSANTTIEDQNRSQKIFWFASQVKYFQRLLKISKFQTLSQIAKRTVNSSAVNKLRPHCSISTNQAKIPLNSFSPIMMSHLFWMATGKHSY